MAINPLDPEIDPLEGVYLLRSLINTIVFDNVEVAAA